MAIKFTTKEKALLSRIKPDKLPRHIAIIMDGNGRWAKKHHLPRIAGHRKGMTSVRTALEVVKHLNVEVLTLYAFSVENWSRPRQEISALMHLLDEYLRNEIGELDKNNVRLSTIGDTSKLPSYARKRLSKSIDQLKNNTGARLVLAINYGGRPEIIRAVKKIIAEVKKGNISIGNIDENLIDNYLDTAGLPEVDLIVRTSGELRVSNFLLWQCAYAEFCITPVLWPDFSRTDLLKTIIDYQKRERRFGHINEISTTPQAGQHGDVNNKKLSP